MSFGKNTRLECDETDKEVSQRETEALQEAQFQDSGSTVLCASGRHVREYKAISIALQGLLWIVRAQI